MNEEKTVKNMEKVKKKNMGREIMGKDKRKKKIKEQCKNERRGKRKEKIRFNIKILFFLQIYST